QARITRLAPAERRGGPMTRVAHDRVKLLHGPYEVPRLRRGDRTFFLFKDCDVVITGWTDARISWPRCRPLDVPRTRPSLLVDEELACAIRQESATALRFWWGVSTRVVRRWRQALGVTCTNNEGSQRLIRAASQRGAEQLRGSVSRPTRWSDSVVWPASWTWDSISPRDTTARGGRRPR